MLLKKDLSQCKDLRTVEHLAQQFGWYAAAWTPQEPHLICSDEQFTEFAKALGKLGVVLKRAQYFITCSGKMTPALRVTPAGVLRALTLLEAPALPAPYEQLSLFPA